MKIASSKLWINTICIYVEVILILYMNYILIKMYNKIKFIIFFDTLDQNTNIDYSRNNAVWYILELILALA